MVTGFLKFKRFLATVFLVLSGAFCFAAQLPYGTGPLREKLEWFPYADYDKLNYNHTKVVGHGVDKDILDEQKAYSAFKFDEYTAANVVGYATEFVNGASVSFNSKTQFDLYNYNGVNFFTVTAPVSVVDLRRSSVSAEQFYFSMSMKNMEQWITLPQSKEKDSIYKWNNFWGWDSVATRNIVK